jgi:hypothetical protein
VAVGVGGGVWVDVGDGVSVSVGVAGERAGSEQAWSESTSTSMVRNSFFMKKTILGRGSDVKEGINLPSQGSIFNLFWRDKLSI